MRSTCCLLLLLVLQTATCQNAVGEDAVEKVFVGKDAVEDVSTDATVLELPVQEFLCTEEGNFTVPDSCSDFYQCQKLSDGSFASNPPIITCPQGTIFDDLTRKCLVVLVPNLITSRPECVSEGTTVTPRVNDCPQDLTEEMANITSDTCRILSSITDYVLLLTSSLPVTPWLNHNSEFNQIVPDYNKVLAKSQKNIRVWKHGNDIFTDIESIFMTSSEFGNEFTRRYAVNQERRQTDTGQAAAAQSIKEAREAIRMMEGEIADIRELLDQTSVSAVKSYFESSIKNKEKRIKEKQQQIQQATGVGHEMEELMYFLELVQSDASVAEQASADLEKRLEQFYRALEGDFRAFENLSIMANASIATLRRERNKLSVHATRYLQQMDRLEIKKKEDEAMLSLLNDASDSKANEIRDLINAIERKEKEFHDQRAKVCPGNIVTSIFDFASRVSKQLGDCNNLQSKYNVSLRGDMNQLDVLNGEFARLNHQRKQILSQIENTLSEMERVRRGQEHGKRILQLDNELRKFQGMVSDLTTLSDETNSAIVLVSEAKETIQGMKDIFHEINVTMNELITRANSPQNVQEKQITITSIDSDLGILMCRVGQFHDIIPAIGECS